MQKLSYIALILVISIQLSGQNSPHGKEFKLGCLLCHTTESWEIDTEKIQFDHGSTKFTLMGQHNDVNCSSCHVDLSFKIASSDCESCHTDMHENSVGFDCARCHTPTNWIVTDIQQIHRMSRFPLLGSHQTADCSECHISNSLLNFQPLGVECADCHMSDYQSAKNPDHVSANYSTDCSECHNMSEPTWSTTGIVHDFFPLSGGHAISNCFECHKQGDFSGLTQNCYSCHKTDYDITTNPSHQDLGFSQDCETCHTITGWTPATFDHDNNFFPIYSGKHNGEWDQCTDCHTSGNDYAVFSCITCHEHNQSDTDDKHKEINGYVYESEACYTCHPNGSEDGSLSHTILFPLTDSHSGLSCSECHSSSYTEASSECVSCHLESYTNAVNPNHQSAGISQQCETCHQPTAWIPSSFNHTTTGFELLGGHLISDCSQCHAGNTSTAISACVSCHLESYTNAINPNHQSAGISQECETCHQSTAWIPSTFSHSTTGFELLGGHLISDCSQCHIGNTTTETSECVSCHLDNYNSAKVPDHILDNYPKECEVCHNTTNWNESTFDHNATNFPLTGVHTEAECSDCHTNGYTELETTCSNCHHTEFDGATNPSHTDLGLSLTCETCHTTEPDWVPAKFPDHNNYFQLLGAHSAISENCFDCHNGNYNSTPNQCYDCHSGEYDNSTNPPHSSAQFPTDCEECHTQNVWIPSTFDHDSQYFPINSGKHREAWNDCSDCHTNSADYGAFSCIDCHEHNQTDMDADHSEVSDYRYQSTACFDCHPNGTEDGVKTHFKMEKILK